MSVRGIILSADSVWLRKPNQAQLRRSRGMLGHAPKSQAEPRKPSEKTQIASPMTETAAEI
jgi:hypothetical protein